MKRKPKMTPKQESVAKLQREFERAHDDAGRLFSAYERAAKRRTVALNALNAARRLP